MTAKNIGLLIAIVVCGVLAWAALEISVENDGLKQVAASQRQSIQTLLDFVTATARCDVKASELASKLRATEFPPRDGTVEVSTLAFKARFRDDRLKMIEIVNVASAPVCSE